MDDPEKIGEDGGVVVSYDETPPNDSMTWHIVTVLEVASIGEAVKCNQIAVVLSDDDRLRRLNYEFLGIDESTDVLAFNLNEPDEVNVEGEIYISLDRVNEQARENGESPMRVLMRLAVHGFLHLCGYDHENGESLQNMLRIGEKYIGSVAEKE